MQRTRSSHALVEETSVSKTDSCLREQVRLIYCRVGSAWLVMHKEEQVKYVAKKVILEGLGAKEQSGCMMEAGLLKNLNHPNIVAYKDSFLGSNSLIIIMEYCEGKQNIIRSSLTPLCDF